MIYNILDNPNKLKKWAYWSIVGGVVIVLLFFIILLFKGVTLWGGGDFNMEVTGQVGDFVGGLVGSIWSLASVLLFVSTLNLQKKELDLQKSYNELNKIINFINSQSVISNNLLAKLITMDNIGILAIREVSNPKNMNMMRLYRFISSSDFYAFWSHLTIFNTYLLQSLNIDELSESDKEMLCTTYYLQMNFVDIKLLFDTICNSFYTDFYNVGDKTNLDSLFSKKNLHPINSFKKIEEDLNLISDFSVYKKSTSPQFDN